MDRSRTLIFAALVGLLPACSYKPGFINEYKIDIQQGNVLTQEMVAQLKPGQTRDQVRFILGTPMVKDIFHQQRWDYVYRYQNGRTAQVETRQFVVFFDGEGRLERVGGDVAAAESDDLTLPANNTRFVELGVLSQEEADKPLPPPEEPGIFRRLMNMFGF